MIRESSGVYSRSEVSGYTGIDVPSGVKRKEPVGPESKALESRP